jgi:hypothetical protein
MDRTPESEITLQELIYQVKSELLRPNPALEAKDPDPLFFVDGIELELSVKVSKERGGGIKLSVLDFAEGSLERKTASEYVHVVKVSLSPLMSKESIMAEILKDSEKRKRVGEKSKKALAKGEIPLEGA